MGLDLVEEAVSRTSYCPQAFAGHTSQVLCVGRRSKRPSNMQHPRVASWRAHSALRQVNPMPDQEVCER